MKRTAVILTVATGVFAMGTPASTPAPATSPAAPATTSIAARVVMATTCVRARVVIIGHRGIGPGTRSLYGTARSEDTVGAFRAAMRAGADGFETDFWPTADNRVVSHHDGTLTRMTNGTGEIRRRTAGYVQRLRNVSGAPVPSFGEVLETMAPTRPHLQQEFKEGQLFSDTVLSRLARSDRAFVDDVQERVLITSSQRTTLRRFHQLAPDLPVGLIDQSSGRPRLSRVPSWVDVILIEFGAADATYIRRAVARGHQVSLRKVNTITRLRQAVRMGAARVVTDRPEVLGRAC